MDEHDGNCNCYVYKFKTNAIDLIMKRIKNFIMQK